MTDAQLLDELKYLGIDQTSYRALALLPMVQVAWADGIIQDEEEELILELAESRFELDKEGRRVLANWLHHSPTEDYMHRGRAALLELAHRGRRMKMDGVHDLDAVIEFSADVAKAAGGLFGFGSVDARETNAIKEIQEAFSAKRVPTEAAPKLDSWDDVFEVIDDEKDPDTDEEDITDVDTIELTSDEMKTIRGSVSCEMHVDPSSFESHAKLTLQGFDDDTDYPIPDDGITVGRARKNLVQISDDGLVSREHMRIERDANGYLLVDGGGVNGTLVNGEKVKERRLFGGELIKVGRSIFRFSQGEEAAPSQGEEAGPADA